ncbi:MAG: sigma-70 family RNA polymerase sigma factor [Gemmatimonadaceae bacterium]|nr:sigma-70 family RNA polymerase sigma factor [Gemmatimonadaceae bacterium]
MSAHAGHEGDRIAGELTLSDAIERLPASLRQVFVLFDVEGFSHAEVADLLGISPVASRKRRSRAVSILQSILRSSR